MCLIFDKPAPVMPNIFREVVSGVSVVEAGVHTASMIPYGMRASKGTPIVTVQDALIVCDKYISIDRQIRCPYRALAM